MRVVVSTAARFAITPDGTLWTDNASFGERFWTRYLGTFEEVAVLARAKPVREPPEGWDVASGEGILSVAIPYYVGPGGFLSRLWSIRAVIGEAIRNTDAVILRLPCAVGSETRKVLGARRPFGAEVLGDPYDVFSAGAIRHRARVLFRAVFSRNLRSECASACAAAYVTEAALQRRYPPGPEAFTTHYSSVELDEQAYVSAPRESSAREDATVVFVGTLQQMYKGPDVLIRAAALCEQAGLRIRLRFVGGGRYLPDLRLQADRAGLGERAEFLGQLTSGMAVRRELDDADLFVLPSRTEGLPSAMLEAMARGLPCIGTSVGGIPELLPPEELVPPNDGEALAQKLLEVLRSPERMKIMSERNLAKARQYASEALEKRRVEFYRAVRERTEAWLRRRI